MYAVFRTGGKQYRATKGDRLRVERLVAGGKVEATVTAQGRAAKIKVLKFKRRKNYMRTKGHRQHFTEVEITSISGGARAKSAAKAASEPAAEE